MSNPSNAGSRRPRWGRRLSFVVLLLFVMVPVAPLVWRWYASRQLDAALARLRAAGEPVTPADLPVDDLLDEHNVSLDYRAAGLLIDESRPAWHRWDECEAGEFTSPLTPIERDVVHTIVADNGPALARVARARSKSIGSWHDVFGPPYLLAAERSNLGSARRLANLLKLAALSAHGDGDDAAAADHLLDLCHLADAAERRPTLIAHLVADGIWAMEAVTVGEVARDLSIDTPGGATRAQVDALMGQLLDERGATGGRRLAWQTERIATVDLMRGVAAGQPLDGSVAPWSTGAAPSAQRYVLGAVMLSDAAMTCDFLGQTMRATQAHDLPAARQQLPTALEAAMKAHPYRHLIARIFLPSTAKAVVVDYRCTAGRRLAATALAVRLYRLDHDGQRPATMDALAPAYLATVLVDPMSGKPFVYRSGEKDPKIYSVGDNGIDNGGVEPDPAKPIFKQRDLDDIVVHLTDQPRPATQPVRRRRFRARLRQS